MTYLLIMDDLNGQNRQKHFDRLLGYSIIIIIVSAITACIGYGIHRAKKPASVLNIAFERVGNLKIEDPVKLKGITIGAVDEIKWRQKNVLVRVKMHAVLKLHRGYSVDNKDIGIMGDRALLIDDGDSSATLVLPSDTLAGTFHPGVSEAVGMAWKLHGVIDSFTVMSAQLLKGGPNRPSLIRKVNGIVSGVDSTSLKLLAIVSTTSGLLSRQLDSLRLLIDAVDRFSKSAASAAPRYESETQKLLDATNKIIDRLDTLTEKTLKIIKAADSSALGTATDRITPLKNDIDRLHNAILRLKDEALQVKVHL
jgi:ABC-type transporter Mla subunit MlaD